MSRSEYEDLTFKIESLHKDGTTYRTIALSLNIYVARSAFHMAIIQYPSDWLVLKHGSLIIGDTRRANAAGTDSTDFPRIEPAE